MLSSLENLNLLIFSKIQLSVYSVRFFAFYLRSGTIYIIILFRNFVKSFLDYNSKKEIKGGQIDENKKDSIR